MKFAAALNTISSQSLSIFIMLLGVGLFVLAAHTSDHDTKSAILTAATGLFTGAFALLKTSDPSAKEKTDDKVPPVN